MYDGMINTQKFKNAIGGIEVSSEEKEKNLQKIKSEIKRLNTTDEININYMVELSYIDFAISYPESLELVKEYYDALYKAKVRNIKVWDGLTYINKNEKIREYKAKIKKTMIYTLIIFGEELIKKDIIEIKDMFGLTTNEITTIFNHYKKIINNKKRIKDLKEENQKYDIAKLIYKEIVINGIKKEVFCKKYNISTSSIDNYLELLKEMDENLYDEVKKTLNSNVGKRFSGLKELINKIGMYCQNKIKINTPNKEILMPFTILDYYSLTKYPIRKTIEFAKDPRNFFDSNKEEKINKTLALRRLETQKNVGKFVSKQQIMNKKMVAGTTEKMVEMTEEICDKLFELFEQENIPKNQELIYIAFRRYALGQPILPLKQLEQTIVLEEENVEQTKNIHK